MAGTPAKWGSDCPISLPEPMMGDPIKVSLGGLAFTPNGLVFDLTDDDRDALFFPPYAPGGFNG